jgi:hypothetical protein
MKGRQIDGWLTYAHVLPQLERLRPTQGFLLRSPAQQRRKLGQRTLMPMGKAMNVPIGGGPLDHSQTTLSLPVVVVAARDG